MHTAFVKDLNKLLTEQLFKVQDVQVLNNPKEMSSTWDRLNDSETQMTGMKPKEAIELNKIALVESYSPEDTLLQPGKEHNNQQESH